VDRFHMSGEVKPSIGIGTAASRRCPCLRVIDGGYVAVETSNQVLSGDAMLSLLRKSMLTPAPFENKAAHQTRRWCYGAVGSLGSLGS
jgi:hypothetical protein